MRCDSRVSKSMHQLFSFNARGQPNCTVLHFSENWQHLISDITFWDLTAVNLLLLGMKQAGGLISQRPFPVHVGPVSHTFHSTLAPMLWTLQLQLQWLWPSKLSDGWQDCAHGLSNFDTHNVYRCDVTGNLASELAINSPRTERSTFWIHIAEHRIPYVGYTLIRICILQYTWHTYNFQP